MKKIFLIFCLVFGIRLISESIFAASCIEPPKSADLATLQEIESACVSELENIQKEKESLSKTISLMETQERTTRIKINQTIAKIDILEEEIATLSGKIFRLDTSLNYISKVFIERIRQTYKEGLVNPLMLLFSSSDFGEFISKYKYLKAAQLHDRGLLVSMEETKMNYDEQKKLKEKIQTQMTALKEQLEIQKANLVSQIGSRKKLLEETKGKEIEYQKLLAITRQELEAIQQIIAGKGEETEVGKVNQGQRIASVEIWSRRSACSTGTHLHFEVRENGDLKNPFLHLKNIGLIDESGGDPHQASGDWDWPLNEPIKFNQGYGSGTAAIRARIVGYNFHTGIDIVSDDRTIKTVKSGTLFRGAVACGGGTLRYVKVDHDDSNMNTYYLHVNY